MEEPQPTHVLRKSARLRNRKPSDEDKANLSPAAERVHKKDSVEVKLEPAGDAKSLKEQPKQKTEDEKQVHSKVGVKVVKEEPHSVKKEDKHYVKTEGGKSDGESSDTGDESEEESDEDPDRLWCICRQPHDDR